MTHCVGHFSTSSTSQNHARDFMLSLPVSTQNIIVQNRLFFVEKLNLWMNCAMVFLFSQRLQIFIRNEFCVLICATRMYIDSKEQAHFCWVYLTMSMSCYCDWFGLIMQTGLLNTFTNCSHFATMLSVRRTVNWRSSQKSSPLSAIPFSF